MSRSTVDTRDRILDAAYRLFGEAGFDATTTREIAELSGVNKALIHYHFRSKEALLESVLDRYYERLGADLAGALEKEGTAREKLARLIDVYVDFLSDNINFTLSHWNFMLNNCRKVWTSNRLHFNGRFHLVNCPLISSATYRCRCCKYTDTLVLCKTNSKFHLRVNYGHQRNNR